MATLTAISFTLAGGMGCFAISLGMFGCALKRRHPFVAARCTARPSNVIYNPSADAPECQQRGNPMLLGWIGWIMNLKFETMLQGIPGTGTRRDGLGGSLLKVNLDGIILLRFHHLCLRVSSLAVVLYLCIVLPIYSSISHCQTSEQCSDHNLEMMPTNLTDYQHLTLANVPSLRLTYEANEFTKVLSSFFEPNHNGILGRLYIVVLCSWIITWYAMHQLEIEWVDVLALRRVYYLEADHWNDRRDELGETLLADDNDHRYNTKPDISNNDDKDNNNNDDTNNFDNSFGSNILESAAGPPHPGAQHHNNHNNDNHNNSNMNASTRELDKTNKSSTSTESTACKDKMTHRDPWVPHPEQRDTVPSIDLYSILVGGLPSLPAQIQDANNSNVENIFSRKQSIDWQLSVTTAFFDHCVPNQPGFSSSVAAVTILPAASHLTEAWKKWYNAAGKLRRLRYIRQQIAERRRQNGESDSDSEAAVDDMEQGKLYRQQTMDNDDYDSDEYNRLYGDDDDGLEDEYGADTSKLRRRKNGRQMLQRQNSTRNVYQDSLAAHKYYQEVLGTNTDLDVESNLLHALHFGPEQTAVYSREFATGAAGIAPNGFCTSLVEMATLDELIEMEEQAASEVHEANTALRRVQEALAKDERSTGDLLDEESISHTQSPMNMRESVQRRQFAIGDFNERGLEGQPLDSIIPEESSVASDMDDFEDGDMQAIMAAAASNPAGGSIIGKSSNSTRQNDALPGDESNSTRQNDAFPGDESNSTRLNDALPGDDSNSTTQNEIVLDISHVKKAAKKKKRNFFSSGSRHLSRMSTRSSSVDGESFADDGTELGDDNISTAEMSFRKSSMGKIAQLANVRVSAGAVIGGVKSVAGGVKSVAGGVKSAAVGSVKTVAGGVKTVAGGVKTVAVGSAKTMAGGVKTVAGGVKTVAGGVKTVATGVADGVKNVATFGNPELLDGFVPKREPRERPSERRRGDVSTTQLPDNLGLESELFRQSATIQAARSASMHEKRGSNRSSASRHHGPNGRNKPPGRAASLQVKPRDSLTTPRRQSNPTRRARSDGAKPERKSTWMASSVECIDEEEDEEMRSTSIRGFTLPQPPSSLAPASASASAAPPPVPPPSGSFSAMPKASWQSNLPAKDDAFVKLSGSFDAVARSSSAGAAYGRRSSFSNSYASTESTFMDRQQSTISEDEEYEDNSDSNHSGKVDGDGNGNEISSADDHADEHVVDDNGDDNDSNDVGTGNDAEHGAGQENAHEDGYEADIGNMKYPDTDDDDDVDAGQDHDHVELAFLSSPTRSGGTGDSGSVSTHESSVWDKLEEDKRRKHVIRARLTSLKALSSEESSLDTHDTDDFDNEDDGDDHDVSHLRSGEKLIEFGGIMKSNSFPDDEAPHRPTTMKGRRPSTRHSNSPHRRRVSNRQYLDLHHPNGALAEDALSMVDNARGDDDDDEHDDMVDVNFGDSNGNNNAVAVQNSHSHDENDDDHVRVNTKAQTSSLSVGRTYSKSVDSDANDSDDGMESDGDEHANTARPQMPIMVPPLASSPHVHFGNQMKEGWNKSAQVSRSTTASTVDANNSVSNHSTLTAGILKQPSMSKLPINELSPKPKSAKFSTTQGALPATSAGTLDRRRDDMARSYSVRSAVSLESQSSTQAADENLKMSARFENSAGLRSMETAEPVVTNEGAMKRPSVQSRQKWSKVEAIVRDNTTEKFKGHRISNGRWKVPSIERVFGVATALVGRLVCCSVGRVVHSQDMVDELAKDSTYAVVTFTSRQAAVAARHCLADSRGGGRWIPVPELPVAPLADAASGNVMYFRGCCRPVTLSLNDNQKLIRNYLALAALGMLYFFYTIPLVAAQRLVSPEKLQAIFPDIFEWQEKSDILANLFSGVIPALVYTGFFALCPAIFKLISNFGSNATSFMASENAALKYFWWFMILAAFSGTSFSTAVIEGFERGISIGTEVQEVIETVARTIPTQVSATWLNWLIIRFSVVLPTQYLLQLNTFIFSFLGFQWASRVVQGGGAGGPVPYRIYVDSGVVMLCVFALAPASPLIAPAAFMYFAACVPLLRWTMIFLYRPLFDAGGQRFPFIFDMMVSGMIVGQVLLVAMMSLKRAIGPALFAAMPMIPTLAFRIMLRRRFLPAFEDAALLQTSLLDGWDTNEEASEDKREEFRRFLVDSHKAAYVPVCIANDQSVVITAEPAVVMPQEADIENGSYAHDLLSHDGNASIGHSVAFSVTPSIAPSITPSITPSLARSITQGGRLGMRGGHLGPQHQHGSMMRRASAAIPRRRVSVAQFDVPDNGSVGMSSRPPVTRIHQLHSPSRFSMISPRPASRKVVVPTAMAPISPIL